MAAFEYVAVDPNGRRRRGVVSADSARLARRELRSRRLTPLKVGPASLGSPSRLQGVLRQSASRKDIVLVTRQLATLIGAAAPVEEALNAVAQQTDKQPVRALLMNVRARVMEGYRLSESLKEHPKAFPPLYRAMVAAGETSGDLALVLDRLADYLEKSQLMRQKVTTALIYPAALALVAIVVVTALMAFVVPKVAEQFESLGAELPMITQALIAVSDAMRLWGAPALMIVALAMFGLSRALQRPDIRRRADAALLNTPLIGKLARGVSAARFARTLATLTQSGAPVLDSLQAARDTVRNLALREAVDEVVISVREGAALSAALRRCEMFPPMMVYMVASGERSGELALLLGKSADHMESEFEATTAVGLKMLEPAIIIAMGAVVLVIVLAILMPILRLNAMALS